jgi:hypothetical protein
MLAVHSAGVWKIPAKAQQSLLLLLACPWMGKVPEGAFADQLVLADVPADSLHHEVDLVVSAPNMKDEQRMQLT